MIMGKTDNLEAYRKQLPSAVYACLRQLKEFDFDRPDGVYTVGAVSVSVESPATEPKEKRKLEGHVRHIDVVYEIDTEEERIGIQSKGTTSRVKERFPEKDLYFYDSGEPESTVVLTTGSFAVCFPEDLHRPLCMGDGGSKIIRKAVAKIPVTMTETEKNPN